MDATSFPKADLVMENMLEEEVAAAVAERMEGKREIFACCTYADEQTSELSFCMTLRPEFNPETSVAILMATAARLVATADEMLPGRQSTKTLIEAFDFAATLFGKETA